MTKQSDIFNNNFTIWKVLGLWSGRKPNKYYKYYSCVYLFITFVLYNSILTLNLAFIPRKIECLNREVIFYLTEITVMSKIFMIIMKRDKIIQAFNLIDGKYLEGDDDISKKILDKNNTDFCVFWKLFAISSNISYFLYFIVPIVIHFIFHTELKLPVSEYYFLSEEYRDTYFVYLFIYQSWGMYGHMMYNVTIDSFIAGLMLTAITQLRVLNTKLINLKLSNQEKKLSLADQENIQMSRLVKCLRRYDFVLVYCDIIQDITDMTVFIVFGVSSGIICVVMSGFLLPSSAEILVSMFIYLFAIILQIFIPGYLGTLLNFESTELTYAAYCTEWMPRSESFKKSIRVFVERTNKPIQMKGLNMVPLSLATFTSILKSAYSFFALIRSFQE